MTAAVLGRNQVAYRFKKGVIAMALTVGAGWGILHLHVPDPVRLAFFVTMFVAGLMMLKSLFLAFLYWGYGFGRVYRRAGKAVAQGRIVPSYIGRNTECSTIVIVDEANKKLYINGDVFAYTDIKSVARRDSTTAKSNGYQAWTEVNPRIEFHLHQGANPLKRVLFDSEAERDSFFARLCNSMNLS